MSVEYFAMDSIKILYSNNFGISFFWKRNISSPSKKIQLVFRDTGLELTFKEFLIFKKQIKQSLTAPSLCKECKKNKDCKSLLLLTPANQISFAMSYHELLQVEDLVRGTSFQLELNSLINT